MKLKALPPLPAVPSETRSFETQPSETRPSRTTSVAPRLQHTANQSGRSQNPVEIIGREINPEDELPVTITISDEQSYYFLKLEQKKGGGYNNKSVCITVPTKSFLFATMGLIKLQVASHFPSLREGGIFVKPTGDREWFTDRMKLTDIGIKGFRGQSNLTYNVIFEIDPRVQDETPLSPRKPPETPVSPRDEPPVTITPGEDEIHVEIEVNGENNFYFVSLKTNSEKFQVTSQASIPYTTLEMYTIADLKSLFGSEFPLLRQGGWFLYKNGKKEFKDNSRLSDIGMTFLRRGHTTHHCLFKLRVEGMEEDPVQSITPLSTPRSTEPDQTEEEKLPVVVKITHGFGPNTITVSSETTSFSEKREFQMPDSGFTTSSLWDLKLRLFRYGWPIVKKGGLLLTRSGWEQLDENKTLAVLGIKPQRTGVTTCELVFYLGDPNYTFGSKQSDALVKLKTGATPVLLSKKSLTPLSQEKSISHGSLPNSPLSTPSNLPHSTKVVPSTVLPDLRYRSATVAARIRHSGSELPKLQHDSDYPPQKEVGNFIKPTRDTEGVTDDISFKASLNQELVSTEVGETGSLSEVVPERDQILVEISISGEETYYFVSIKAESPFFSRSTQLSIPYLTLEMASMADLKRYFINFPSLNSGGWFISGNEKKKFRDSQKLTDIGFKFFRRSKTFYRCLFIVTEEPSETHSYPPTEPTSTISPNSTPQHQIISPNPDLPHKPPVVTFPEQFILSDPNPETFQKPPAVTFPEQFILSDPNPETSQKPPAVTLPENFNLPNPEDPLKVAVPPPTEPPFVFELPPQEAASETEVEPSRVTVFDLSAFMIQ